MPWQIDTRRSGGSDTVIITSFDLGSPALSIEFDATEQTARIHFKTISGGSESAGEAMTPSPAARKAINEATTAEFGRENFIKDESTTSGLFYTLKNYPQHAQELIKILDKENKNGLQEAWQAAQQPRPAATTAATTSKKQHKHKRFGSSDSSGSSSSSSSLSPSLRYSSRAEERSDFLKQYEKAQQSLEDLELNAGKAREKAREKRKEKPKVTLDHIVQTFEYLLDPEATAKDTGEKAKEHPSDTKDTAKYEVVRPTGEKALDTNDKDDDNTKPKKEKSNKKSPPASQRPS